jgi:nucleotide-binding universal stress UspA family protein
MSMYKRIVVGTDGSPSASEAVREAVSLAKLCGAELHIVSAYRPLSALMTHPEFVTLSAQVYEKIDPAGGAAEVTSRALGFATGANIEVTEHQVAGTAADALCDVAANVGADLIVVGSRGMTGARRVLGSVPNSVAHNASCSVLIVQTV